MNAAPPEQLPLQRRLSEIAVSAKTLDQWLQAITVEIAQSFAAAVVAVQAPDGSRPRMFVIDERVAAMIDREQIRSLLAESRSDSVHNCQILTANQVLQAWTIRLPIGSVDRPSLLLVPIQLTDDLEHRLHEFVTLIQQCPWSEKPAVTTAQPVPVSSSIHRVVLRSFHDNLDPLATSMRIASQTPSMVGCDRVMVLLARPNSWIRSLSQRLRSTSTPLIQQYRVVAVSGVALIDRRSPLVRASETLVAACSILRCKLRFSASETSSDVISPQLSDSLEQYFDQSSGLSVIVVPILDHRFNVDAGGIRDDVEQTDLGRIPIAMMLLESFSGPPMDTTATVIDEIATEASVAIGNALAHDNVFALPIRRPLAGVSRSAIRNWIVSGLLLLLVATAAACLIRVDHTVIATGTARPENRRAVFASVDGIVDQVHVTDGQSVRTGDRLLSLKSIELEAETETLSGQLITATERLGSLRSMRVVAGNEIEGADQNLMEQRTLVREIETLTERLKINQQRQDALNIHSPINGTVVAWRMEQRLMQRPVTRGDRLLSVIDPKGSWELDLRLPQRWAGEVLQRLNLGETLPIRFAISSQPTRTYNASVRSVSQVARVAEDGSSVVDVVASVNPDDAPEMSFVEFRGDDEVTAKIICGKRRWIDSATTDVFAWVHRNVLFRFLK